MNGSCILNDFRFKLAQAIALENAKNKMPEPLAISPWMAMSLLQKAIRRGHIQWALAAAVTLLDVSPDRLWRRLCVTAYEDIGIADLDLVAYVSVSLKGKTVRKELGGEWSVANHLIQRMCAAPKCRAADDLMIVAERASQLDQQRFDMTFISAIHEAKGLPNPTNTKLIKATLRGIQRAHGVPQNQVSPLLVEDLTHIICLMGNDVKSLRNKALLLIGFAGGLRRSELVALDRDDIEVARQGIIVTIRRSKTDQLGEGRRIGIPNARGPHCPALSLEKWLQRIPDSPGPIFRPVTKAGQIRDTRLSTEAIAKIVKGAVTLIGLDSASYSGHSLRAGLATSAAMHGVSTIAIRRQTGHASDSMLARYVRSGELFMNNAVGALL